MVMAVLIISFIAILVTYFYVHFKKSFGYWKERNVPSLCAWPLVGSYAENLSFNRHYSFIQTDIYNSYENEKYVGGFKGSRPELLIRDPDLIRTILVKDFNFFHDRNTRTAEHDILTQHLFNLKGDKWRLLRQKLTPTFTSMRMKMMFPLIVECGEALQTQIGDLIQKDNEIEIKELMAKFTTDTIGSCVFGLKMNSISDEDAVFRKVGRNIDTPSKRRVILRFIANVVPGKLISFFKIRDRSKEMENFFVGIVKQMLEHRKIPSDRHDFMDMMIELKAKGHLSIPGETLKGDHVKGVFKITDELITAQCFVFFGAGFETSSTTMSYALREIALNPNVQTKLLNEIDSVLNKHDGKLTYEAIQEMHYLEMVIKETLRKYPPLGVLNRTTAAEYKIPGTNIVLDKDVDVMIPVYALHHDAQYFPDPEQFRPQRFSHDSEKTYHSYSYLPFGEGPRNCIGFRFGKLQAFVGLVSILSQYSVEKCDRTPINLEYHTNTIILCTTTGSYLRFKPRNKK